MTGPACGNNPNYRMSDGDRRVVEDFKAYLAARAALRDRIAAALYERERPPREPAWPAAHPTDRETFGEMADAAMPVVLSATAELSETERKMLEYALDLADTEVATDGSDFTDEEEDALAELRRIVTKPIATGTFELRGNTEIRAAALREAAQRLYTALFPAVYADLGQKAAEGVNRAASELRRMADETQPAETEAAELLALATVLEIPRPGNALPLQLRRSYGHADRWAICDREGRRWDRELSCWVYEAEGIRDEALRDATRFTLAEAVPLARKLAAGARQDGAQR